MKKDWWILFNVVILLFFAAVYIAKRNYEFLTSIVIVSFVVWILYRTDKVFKYYKIVKWGFSIWLFLHLAGGIFELGGTRFYSLILIPIIGDPYFILRYDQAMHFFFYFVASFFIYSLLTYITKSKPSKIVFPIIMVLATIGVGALNEIMEFSTVVLFGATGIGNYTNNAIDLVFNLIGALTGAFFILRKK